MRELNSILIEGIVGEVREANSTTKILTLYHNKSKKVQGDLFDTPSQNFTVLAGGRLAGNLFEVGEGIRVVGKIESNGLGVVIVAEHIEFKL